MSNCPKCNHPDFYQGITSSACENTNCDLHVKAQGRVSSREGVDGTTEWLEDPWESHPSSADSGDASPSGSQGGIRPEEDWEEETDPFASLDFVDWSTVTLWVDKFCPVNEACYLASADTLHLNPKWEAEAIRRQTAALNARASQVSLVSPPATPVTPNTLLPEVHEDLSEEELSQLQSLADSLQSSYVLLANLAGSVQGANAHARCGRKPHHEGMLSDLLALRAKLPELEDTLEQCDQFLHRLQSEDQHPSAPSKSVGQYQMDMIQWSFAPGSLASNDSKNQHPSYEKPSLESWQDYAHCTYLSDSLGFERGLSLALGTRVDAREWTGRLFFPLEVVVQVTEPLAREFGWPGYTQHFPLPRKDLTVAEVHHEIILQSKKGNDE